MKLLVIIISAALFSSQALACTKNDSKAISKIKRIFQLDGSPVDWVSVKTRTNAETKKQSVLLNRAFPVTVYATSRVNTSRIKFKRDTYDLKDAKICFKGKKVLITHEFGELLVTRRGRDLESSIITLKQNGGLFTLRLRPKKLLGNKRSIDL